MRPAIAKLATAAGRLYVLDNNGAIWLDGFHGWDAVRGPVDELDAPVDIVDIAATFDTETEDGHTLTFFCLYVLARDGRLFTTDRYGAWSQQRALP